MKKKQHCHATFCQRTVGVGVPCARQCIVNESPDLTKTASGGFSLKCGGAIFNREKKQQESRI